jgi:hypothetical protein
MRTIAIGVVAFALAATSASAQTPDEQARILRDFQQSVADYTQQRHTCLDVLPQPVTAATPAPRIFTLPVAMVFRQLIAKSLIERGGAAAIGGVGAHPHAKVLEPFPSTSLTDFPPVLQEALPRLPDSLEYRLIGDDLVLRDTQADLIVGVLRDAVGPALTVIR